MVAPVVAAVVAVGRAPSRHKEGGDAAQDDVSVAVNGDAQNAANAANAAVRNEHIAAVEGGKEPKQCVNALCVLHHSVFLIF